MFKLAKLMGLLLIGLCLLPLVGCQDPGSSMIQSTMENRQRKDEADKNYAMEMTRLQWEKQKYAMEREDQVRKEQQERMDRLRQERRDRMEKLRAEALKAAEEAKAEELAKVEEDTSEAEAIDSSSGDRSHWHRRHRRHRRRNKERRQILADAREAGVFEDY